MLIATAIVALIALRSLVFTFRSLVDERFWNVALGSGVLVSSVALLALLVASIRGHAHKEPSSEREAEG